MNTFRNLPLALVLLFACVSTPMLAQAPAKPGTCSQPMRDAVSNISINRPQYAIATADNCWIFAVARGQLAVLKRENGSIREVQVPEEVAMGIPAELMGAFISARRGVALNAPNPSLPQGVPQELLDLKVMTAGLALTHDGKTLFASADNRVVFFNVEKLTSGQTDAVLGEIRDERFGGAGHIIVTGDDKYMFVAQERTAWVSVIDLAKARNGSFGAAAIIGGFPAGSNPRFALTPDDRFLYVATQWPNHTYIQERRCRNPAYSPTEREGAILVVDVERAKSSPVSSVISTTPASCFPSGIALSPDGNTLYEEAREEGSLLVFDTRRARAGDTLQLVGIVPVGNITTTAALTDTFSASKGQSYSVTVINGGKQILALDPSYPAHKISVIDAAKAAKSSPDALIGTLPTEKGPISLVAAADGHTLLMTDQLSGKLAVIDLDRLAPEPAQLRQIFIAPTAQDGARVLGPVARLTQTPTFGDQSPAWSPDGNFIAFKRDSPGGPGVPRNVDTIVYSMEDGREKIYPTKAGGPIPRWFKDGKSILEPKQSEDGAQRLFYRLDLNTGGLHETGIPVPTGGIALAVIVGDDTLFIGDRSSNIIAVWSLKTGKKLKEFAVREIDSIFQMALSPDGQTIAGVTVPDPSTSQNRLFRVGVDGQGYKELAIVRGGRMPAWTRKGEAILFGQSEDVPPTTAVPGAPNVRIMRIPAIGGKITFTGLEVTDLVFMDIGPNGSIAFSGMSFKLSKDTGQ